MWHVLHDLGSQMLRMIAGSGIGYLLAALFLCGLFADRCIQEAPNFRTLGQAFGVFGFLGYVVWDYRQHGEVPYDSDLLNAVIRGLICAGFATCLAWLFLTVGSVLFGNRSIGISTRLFSRKRR